MIPIGYKRVDGCPVIDESTAPLVREVYRMYIAGEGVKNCVDYLNEHGVTGSHGGKISMAVVYRMLRNKRYLGIFDESGIELQFDPIIDEATFEEAQKMHKGSKQNAAAKAKDEYLLSCCCFCGYCGTMLVGDSGTGKSGRTYHYYTCGKRKRKGSKACQLKSLNRDFLDDLVISVTVEDMLTEETIKALTDEVMDIQADGQKESPAVALKSALDGNKKKQANIVRAIEIGNAPDILVSRLQELQNEATDLEAEIRQAEYERPTVPREAVEGWLRSFKMGDKKDPAFRKRLVETFVARVDVYKDKAVIYYNITEKRAASGVRIRPVTWTFQVCSRTLQYSWNSSCFSE